MSVAQQKEPVFASGAEPNYWRLFGQLRLTLLKNAAASLLRESTLRLSLILLFSLVFWLLLFGLFFEGFYFISNELIGYLFSLFFLFLLVMLFFSTGLILYSGMFRSREAEFLLVTPAPPDQLFAFKLQEALLFSSWGFLLLGSPMMIAYGLVRVAPVWFYSVFLAYFIAFIFIPAGLGAIACILIVTYFPRRRLQVLIGIGVAISAVLAWRLWRALHGMPAEVFTETWLDALLGRLRFARNPLLPSQWVASGLLAAAAGRWRESLFYLLVLAANGAFLYVLAASLAGRLYREGFSRAYGTSSARLARSWFWLDNLFSRVVWFIHPNVRLIILKDIRTFRRDPVQWSQFLIFFGLLALYFINIRNMGYDLASAYWRNLVSFLNLAVTALLLAAFTSRFIFPTVSLEGNKFWILGLLPLEREHILWGKFWFSVGISLVASEALVVLSDVMLRLDWPMIMLHAATILILCMGLAGLAVGLGARLPNLRETDPSKIAAGFGGTLNLVLSMLYILAVIVLLALPYHLYYASVEAERYGHRWRAAIQFRAWMALSISAAIGLSYAATVVPMRLGAKAFRELEV